MNLFVQNSGVVTLVFKPLFKQQPSLKNICFESGILYRCHCNSCCTYHFPWSIGIQRIYYKLSITWYTSRYSTQDQPVLWYKDYMPCCSCIFSWKTWVLKNHSKSNDKTWQFYISSFVICVDHTYHDVKCVIIFHWKYSKVCTKMNIPRRVKLIISMIKRFFANFTSTESLSNEL